MYKSLSSRLNALITPGVNRTKNGPGLSKKKKNAAVKYMCKSHMIVSVFFYSFVVVVVFFNRDDATALGLWLARSAANGDALCS